MTQADLARKAKIFPYQISYFENGKKNPSLGAIINLARTLGVTIDYLIGETPQEITAFFQNTEKLSKRDKDCIQDLINMITDKK